MVRRVMHARASSAFTHFCPACCRSPAMSDLNAAVLTQLRNIQAKSGKTLKQLADALASSGLAKHGEKRQWLMDQFQLGYGDANTAVTVIGKGVTTIEGNAPVLVKQAASVASDELDAIYAGPKAELRALHEHILKSMAALGAFEQAPKKSYVSLRRKKQFAMVGPATKTAIEIGLNHKGLPPHARLKVMPPGGMCQYTTRVSSVAQLDADVLGWVRAAYDAAG